MCITISGLGNSAFYPEAAKTVNFRGYAGVALGSMLLALLLLEGQSLQILIYTVPSLVIGVGYFMRWIKYQAVKSKGKEVWEHSRNVLTGPPGVIGHDFDPSYCYIRD